MELKEIIDTIKYPIHQKDSLQYEELLNKTRVLYQTNGLVTLPDFLLPAAVASAVQNINANMDKVFYTDDCHNMFIDPGDLSYDVDHVRNLRLHTQVGALAYDYMDPSGSLLTLYKNDDFRNFLRQVLGLDELHRLDDPLGACFCNIFTKGTKHAWHFDNSCHSVTIMLQKPVEGGLFRHTSPIRDRKEINSRVFAELENVLANEKRLNGAADSPINTLVFEPGTLSIFSGSVCLHEVTEVFGDVHREVAVLRFTSEKGKKNPPHVQKTFFGRVKQ